MGENIEVKDVQKTEYLDKNGLDMLWVKVKENTHNQVEVERNRAVAKENSIVDTKADKSALANEVTRATGAESGLQAAIATKADATALSNYVLTTALNQQIDTLNTAISAKADTTALTVLEAKVTANTTAINNIGKSNGIPYDTSITNYYQTNKPFYIKCDNDHTAYINPYSGIKVANSDTSYVSITPSIMKFSDGNASCEINEFIGGMQCLSGTSDDSNGLKLSYDGLRIGKKSAITQVNNGELISISVPYNNSTSDFKVNLHDGIKLSIADSQVTLNSNGIYLPNGDNNHVLTSNSSTIDISQYALKSELPAVPTKTSQLTNDSNFITADVVDDGDYYLYDAALNFGSRANQVLTLDSNGITSTIGFSLNGSGITFDSRGISDIPTAQGSFINIDNYALNSQVTALEQTVTDNTTALEGKQDKGNYVVYSSKDQNGYVIDNAITVIGNNTTNKTKIVAGGITFYYKDNVVKYSAEGIRSNKFKNCLVTSDGTFEPVSNFVLSSAYNEKIAALEARIAALEAKHPEAAA